MGQPTLRTLFFRTGAEAGNSPTALEKWRAARIRRAPEPPEVLCRQEADDEADYCLARAEVEFRRAEEAAHPAARDAHLQMAALYCRRASAADRVEDPACRNWMRYLDA